MKRVLAGIACVALTFGCASKEVLQAKSADVPAGVNLTGIWSLRDDGSLRQLEEEGIRAAGGREGILGRRARSASSRRAKGSLIYVFLETATDLKITQTESGLFISFDRAIVEEYRFGEYRPINVGPVLAARASGWENNGYFIETLDENGNKLQEHYTVESGGQALLRQISVWEKGVLKLSLVQTFDRQE